MKMSIQVLKEIELDEILPVVKNGIYEFVEAVFGWDDGFQKTRLLNEYDACWYHWVFYNNQKVGLVCFKFLKNNLHLHFLILFPEFQGKGIGVLVMEYLHNLARQESSYAITLSSFITNDRAVNFYKKLGYQVILKEDDFYNMAFTIDY